VFLFFYYIRSARQRVAQVSTTRSLDQKEHNSGYSETAHAKNTSTVKKRTHGKYDWFEANPNCLPARTHFEKISRETYEFFAVKTKN